MLKGINLAFIILYFFRKKIQHTVHCVFCQASNPSKNLRILSTALNLDRIPLIGLGTYAVKTSQVFYNALKAGSLD